MATADPTGTVDVVPRDEAARMLQRRGVVGLVMGGHLETAPLPNGLRGVTRASVEREIEWQRSATRGQRIRRRLRDVVDWF